MDFWRMSKEQPKTTGKKVTTFVTFLIENSNFWNLISINENGPLQNRLLFNTEIVYITGLLIFEKPNYDKIFVAIHVRAE